MSRGVSDRSVQSQKRVRSLNEEKLYCLSGENKGADQLCSYCTADLRLCFRIGKNPAFSRCGSNNGISSTKVAYFVL